MVISTAKFPPNRIAVCGGGLGGNLAVEITMKELLEADRKSTRLNSSHDQISYAVFCLKKKQIHERKCTLLNSCYDQISHCVFWLIHPGVFRPQGPSTQLLCRLLGAASFCFC